MRNLFPSICECVIELIYILHSIVALAIDLECLGYPPRRLLELTPKRDFRLSLLNAMCTTAAQLTFLTVDYMTTEFFQLPRAISGSVN